MEKFIFSRHAEKISEETPEGQLSERYFGITKEGEEKSREQTHEIAKIIENLPDRSVIILGGTSMAIRTKSTLEVYTDELRNIYENNDNIIFPASAEELKEELPIENKIFMKYIHHQLETLKLVGDELNYEKNEHKKAVVQFPLWIKQFTTSPEEWEEWKNYFNSTTDKVNEKNEMAEWIGYDKEPNPKKIADAMLVGLKRQQKFFKKFFPDNELVFINVGHNWMLDALFTLLANDEKISKEGFEKTGGEELKYNEFGELDFLPDSTISFRYRDKKYIYSPQKDNNE